MELADFKKEYASCLNPQQWQAVETVEGYVLLLAVPGSGKTTVLVTRLGYMLLRCGIAPEKVLTMTYTVSAAGDMSRRFAALFGEELARRVTFRTINSVCFHILRYFEQTTGRRVFSLVEEARQSALIRELYHRQTEEYPTDAEVKSLLTSVAYVKNQMLTPEEIETMAERLPHFPAVYQEYQTYLREHRQMDYDDQMVYALQILRKYPQVLYHFQQQYPYLCVDEAQDTSRIQHAVISLLAEGGGNLFMVGDEDQSIYGFRAAYPQALLHFTLDHPGARVLLMEQNYRSTREIVAAADAFIQKNSDRHPKHMKAVRGNGEAVRKIELRNRQDQYGYLAKVAAKCTVSTAVLYRDNDCALPLIDLLERKNIPYTLRKPDTNFFTHRVVRDITDMIRFAQDPTDGELLSRFYYKLGAGLTKKAVHRAIHNNRNGLPLLQILSEDDSLKPYVRSHCKMLATYFANLLDVSADRAIYCIVHFMGYGEYLEECGADTSKADILETLGSREKNALTLLDRLAQLQEIIESKEHGDAPFVLSTVHSSKGLEYDRVFLMDIIDGICPKMGKDTDENEERRIFYVAMTRAKNELDILTFSNNNFRSGFAEELFSRPDPVPKLPAGPEVRTAFPASPYGHTTAEHISSTTGKKKEKIVWASKDYIPGISVVHAIEGRGRVTDRKDDIVTICFASGVSKSYSLSILLERELIRVAY